METARGRDGEFQRGDEAMFTGDVWIRSGPIADDGTNVNVVHFSPMARTRWHRHPGGQFLIGLAGRGRVRSRGERTEMLEPGDVFFIPPGEWHFHGGDARSPMTHVAINGGGAPEWGEPVTDVEYGEG
jgi:quercetin dioxygenase-like cupin family protein